MSTNSEPATETSKRSRSDVVVGNIAADRLLSIVERVERLEDQKKALSNDVKDIYAEAKSAGFDPKVVKMVIKLRQKEPAELQEEETLLDLYRRALGL